MIGLEINGYQVRAVIGSGGMGKVYLGVHPLIGAKAAIKVLLPHFAADQAQTDRFIREARVLSSLNHDRIVKITGFGVLPDGRNYMVMEHLEGAPLSRLIELESPMPASKVLALVDQILDALSAAHAAGIVHRDLKPMNVLVLRSGTDRKVKLLDFGLARAQALRLPQDLERALDKGSLVMGTPEYVPPEQVRGQPPTPASDLYSLGVIMFELLTKRLPFSGETAGDMVAHHLRDQAPRVSSVIPVVPALLDELVAAMLSKVPEERGAPAEKIRRIVQKLAKDLAEQDAAFRRGTTTNSGAGRSWWCLCRTGAARPPLRTRRAPGPRQATPCARSCRRRPARRRPPRCPRPGAGRWPRRPARRGRPPARCSWTRTG